MSTETNEVKRNWNETDIPSLTGKTALITGANSGLGYELSRMLAAKGARVLMACRNPERGWAALEKIRSKQDSAKLDYVPLDLTDLKSVAKVGDKLKELGVKQIDLLLNNAGIMALPKRHTTEQGFEAQFGTNHLGHFALTRELYPLLADDARIMTVSSIANLGGDINWDDPQWEKAYDPWGAYRQSKTANLLFTLELTNRLKKAKSKRMATSAHPGVSSTNLTSGSTMAWMGFIGKALATLSNLGLKFLPIQSANAGALPLAYAAVGDAQPGAFYGTTKTFSGPPRRTEDHAAPYSKDAAAATRLWELSEELIGAKFEVS